VKREVDDRLRPPSGQSVLNSPARSSRSSQELALAPDHGTSTTPPTEINAIETTIASIQSATPSADLLVPADDPPPSPIVNFESTTLQTASAVEDTHVDLDKLRVAIEEGDTNLFVTLHVALDDLFSAARSQEVHTVCCSAFSALTCSFRITTTSSRSLLQSKPGLSPSKLLWVGRARATTLSMRMN